MTIRDAALGVHICAGVLGLICGPFAMAASKSSGRHPLFGRTYQLAIAVLTLSALVLVAEAPDRLWGFAVIAVATELAASTGWILARRRPRGWLPVHVGTMLGSYVSLVTALLVVNISGPLSWVLPTIVGTPLIAVTARRSALPAFPVDDLVRLGS